ncbi:hypothetical protein [uncultured Winogradskyella sp.]|uniref:hypothetical protein n=1 Tax=uncultured Winogradskyella sp. TaxID=395353 RepID=UPI002635D834|nr:hypothetical protein [uncultured Winogradskyella sp.]
MKKLNLFVAISVLFVTVCISQNYRIQNGIGVFGGVTQFNIDTDNLATTSEGGWLAGLAATVDLPNRWYNLSYNIQLSENKLGIAAIPVGGTQAESIDYKVFTAQIALLGHIKIFKNHLTIDAGPMLQYNSDLDLQDETKENYLIDGYNTIRANQITEISRFNVNGAVGASLGFDEFKLRAQYIYGFTNILSKLNKENFTEDVDFKGNQSMLVLTAMFVF